VPQLIRSLLSGIADAAFPVVEGRISQVRGILATAAGLLHCSSA
jgi:hypothetical protein